MSLDVGSRLGHSDVTALIGGGGMGLGGSGTVVVNTLSATRVSGTFSCTLVPSSGGATGTVRVTQGAFDVKLPCPPP